MRRSLAKFSESEASNHTPSLADFTTTTPELKFSVHTACSTAVSCYEISPGSLKCAKFPVKFPVGREFRWRRVRSALRRQPSGERPVGGVSACRRRCEAESRGHCHQVGERVRPIFRITLPRCAFTVIS